MASKQRIFISGVAGFLGSHLADAFLADGHAVVGIDNMIGGYLDNVPTGCEFYQLDCNDSSRVREHMKGVDIVYHCAATAYEGLSVFSPHMVTQNIVTASTGMISAAVANRVRRFVMCSSMARYGTNDVPFTEEMTPKPQDPYGIGKYAAELMLQSLAETHGMEWVIAVPHNIVGPRQKIRRSVPQRREHLHQHDAARSAAVHLRRRKSAPLLQLHFGRHRAAEADGARPEAATVRSSTSAPTRSS